MNLNKEEKNCILASVLKTFFVVVDIFAFIDITTGASMTTFHSVLWDSDFMTNCYCEILSANVTSFNPGWQNTVFCK